MRKAQKRQAEEFVESLGQANKKIRKIMERGEQVPLALALLEQCQEGAVSLGNMIEQLEGEDTVTVRLLENFCELIYQYHEKIRQGLPVKAGHEYKNLQKSIGEIESSIHNDLSVRKEVVFLPYKASMWDSLESVWKAADADPDCDAYVIPIPYYDKNPDGSFKEMHYEGRLYPKDVPIVWYEDYDFEERRPDAVFIHNPYDEHNYVTSVHPDFYSQKLKMHTEMLVYIPYGLPPKINPKDAEDEVIRRMARRNTLPVMFNADRVIVQSEAARQRHIAVMSMKFGKETREIWAKKTLGIGSPKVDKVRSTRREDIEIPEEWLKVICRADGSWKKVVFYNTSIGALLEQDIKMLVKMRSVFKTFRENREELALLWRPHPLIQATITSMCPHLWPVYQEMLQEYQNEGWGIYDDTADLDRAVILCNAYYGDISSVAQLCEEAGKDVMIQNVQEETALSVFLQLVENERVQTGSTNSNIGYEIYKTVV